MAKIGDIIEYLRKNGVYYELIEHPPAFSAHEVAIASHVQDKDLAKTLVVKAGDRFLMAVLPADHRLDERLLENVLKEKRIHLAHEDELKPTFPDCEIGAMPPFGNLYAVPVYMDASLAGDTEIAFNACSHSKSIRMKMADYMRLVNPTVANFSHARFKIEEQ
jgi:Ala-tRNA(Pro) deacylase